MSAHCIAKKTDQLIRFGLLVASSRMPSVATVIQNELVMFDKHHSEYKI